MVHLRDSLARKCKSPNGAKSSFKFFRAGKATQLLKQNVQAPVIMERAEWKHPRTMAKYADEELIDPNKVLMAHMEKSDDEEEMKQHTFALLETYIREAPPSAHIWEGEYWDKVHMGWVGGRGGYKSMQSFHIVRWYGRELKDTDPLWMERAYGPNARGDGQTGAADTDSGYLQFTYKNGYKRRDKKVAYLNPKYPWIEAVWKIQRDGNGGATYRCKGNSCEKNVSVFDFALVKILNVAPTRAPNIESGRTHVTPFSALASSAFINSFSGSCCRAKRRFMTADLKSRLRIAAWAIL